MQKESNREGETEWREGGGRGGNAGEREKERDMEGHCLWGSVFLFALQLNSLSVHFFFYIIPPIVIKHVLGPHIGLVNYPI